MTDKKSRKNKEPVRMFYHVTRREYVKSILNSSLMPGKDTRKCNIYHEMRGDPSYIYLWNKRNAKELSREVLGKKHGAFNIKTHTLLEITLPLHHPVEKDYDQLLYILNNLKAKDWKNLWVGPFLERFGIKFNGPLSKINLIYHIDLIPEYCWSYYIGSYRTAKSINRRYIREIGFEHLPIY